MEEIKTTFDLVNGGDYTRELLRIMKGINDTEYNPTRVKNKSKLTKKQSKSRIKNKAA